MQELLTSQQKALIGDLPPLRSASTERVVNEATTKLQDLATTFDRPDMRAQRTAVLRRKNVVEGKPDFSSFSEQFFNGLRNDEKLFPAGTWDVLISEVGEEGAIKLAELEEQRRQNDALEAIAVALNARAEAERNRTKSENDQFERERCAQIRRMGLSQQLASWEQRDIWQPSQLNELNWFALVEAAKSENKLSKLGRWLQIMFPDNTNLIRRFFKVCIEQYPTFSVTYIDQKWDQMVNRLREIESQNTMSSQIG